MENNYLITLSYQRHLKALNLTWVLLIFSFILVSTGAFAQPPACPNKLEYGVHYEIPSDDATSDGRLRISGLDPAVNYDIAWNLGSTYVGTNTTNWTTTLANVVAGESGHLATNLSNPGSGGQAYFIRVTDPTNGGCGRDTTFVVSHADYGEEPDVIDLRVTIAKDAGVTPTGAATNQNMAGDLDGTIQVAYTITNENTEPGYNFQTADNVELTIYDPTAGADLQYVAIVSQTGGTGTYTPGAGGGVWSVGSIAPGASVTLILSYQIVNRGIYQLSAQITDVDATYEDLDSHAETTAPNFEEDDEAETCVSTPYDYCRNDEFRFELSSSAIYAYITWQQWNGSAWVALAPQGTANASGAGWEIVDSVLIIQGVGLWNYSRDVGGGCGAAGCCPMEIEPGIEPLFDAIAPQAVCFGTAPGQFDAVDLTPSTDYDRDRGNVVYQWLIQNGPIYDTIPGETNLTIPGSALPDTTGSYVLRIIGMDDLHQTCADTTEVQLEILDIEKPIAMAYDTLCAEETMDLFITNTTDYPAVNNYTFTWSSDDITPWTETLPTNISATQRVNADSSMSGYYYVEVGVTFNYFSSSQTCSRRDTTHVLVNPLPTLPNPINYVYCQSDPYTTVDSLRMQNEELNKYFIYWHDPSVLPLDTVVHYGEDRPFPNISNAGSTTYNVWYVDRLTTCVGHDTTQTVVVRPKPTSPAITNYAYCEDIDTTGVTITATLTETNLVWYGVDTTDLDTARTLTYPVGGPYGIVGTMDPLLDTIWVSQELFIPAGAPTLSDITCESDKVPVTIQVLDKPDNLSFITPEYCVNVDPLSIEPLRESLSPQLNSLTVYPPADTTYEWDFAGSVTTVGSPTPDPLALGVGSHYGTVTEAFEYTYALPDNFVFGDGNGGICVSDVLPVHVVFNPVPESNVIALSALCNGDTELSNGTLILNRYEETDQMEWNFGATYNPASAPAGGAGPAPSIETTYPNGVFTSSLPNPATTEDYFVRVTNRYNCVQDIPVTLTHKDCVCPGGYCEPATITPNF